MRPAHFAEWQKSIEEQKGNSAENSDKWNQPVIFDTEEGCRNWLKENVHRIQKERMAYWKNNPNAKSGIVEQEKLLYEKSAEIRGGRSPQQAKREVPPSGGNFRF